MSIGHSWRARAALALASVFLGAAAANATPVHVCATCTTEQQVVAAGYTWGMANIPQHYAVFIVTTPYPYAIQKCFQRINTVVPPYYTINTVAVLPSMSSCPNPAPPLGP
jgi:hypothetical protein